MRDWRLLAIACVFGAAGCVETHQGPSKLVFTNPEATGRRSQEGAASSRTDSLMRISLDPLGEITFDGTLPLISPDGTCAAVQLESNADWPTILGDVGQTRNLVGRIAIIDLTARPLAVKAELRGPYLLGRSCDAEGFLVESPKEDGTRGIALASWADASLKWLVQDEFVNSFAVRGPRGELAYSRRRVSDRTFELVLNRPEGVVSFSTDQGHSWILPTFAPGGAGIYAMRLFDGTLSLGYMRLATGRAETTETLRPALILRALTLRASLQRAFQATTMMNGLAGTTPDGALLFYHPDFFRMALWDAERDSLELLTDGSMAALPISSTSILTSLKQRLTEQPLPPHAGDIPALVLEGLWLPRSNIDAQGRLLVVNPERAHMSLAWLTIGPR